MRFCIAAICGALALAPACSSDEEAVMPTNGDPDAAASQDARPADAAPDRRETGVSDARADTAVADSGRTDTGADGPDPEDARPDRSPPRDAGADGRADAAAGDPACALVSCASASDHSCCADMYSFALNAMDTPEPDLQTGFSGTARSVTADFRFDAARQDGAIGFAFPRARMPSAIRITATWTGPVNRPFCTLEGSGAGCAYPFGQELEADLDNPLFCWGGQHTPDRVSFRIESTGAGAARLSITGVELR